MKTEKQSLALMEKAIDAFNALMAKYHDDAQPTGDDKDAFHFYLGGIFHLGVILDCEEELKGLFLRMKLADTVSKIARMVDTKEGS